MQNRYLFPAVMLATFVGILVLFAASAHRALARQGADYADTEAKLEALKRTQSTKKTALDVLQAASSPSNSFMKSWESELVSRRDEGDMLVDFSRFGNDSTVSVQGRRSSRSEYPWRTKQVQVRSAEAMGASSEFYRLMNWLGDMERTWPLARFDNISFEQRGGSLHLSLRMIYPSFLTENSAN